MKRDEFKVGKLYYLCTCATGKYPVPKIEAYVLDRIEEDGLLFISPEELNVREPLAKLSLDDRFSILNVLSGNGGLRVPYSELGNMFSTPEGAIGFLKESFRDTALADLL